MEKPGIRARAFQIEAERRIYMIMLLVDLLLVGKVTVIIVWRRKGQR